jgi:hypothetical protein
LHYQGHQKGEKTAGQENQKADTKATWAGGQTSASLAAALLLCPLCEWDPWYTSQEQAGFETEGKIFLPDGWWKFTDGCIAIPESLTYTFVKQFHEGTHSGQIALETTLAQHFYVPRLSSISKTVCERCSLWARNNPWYLLVFVYTFSGWIKPFPTWTEKGQKVARSLLKEIVPQFRIPVFIGLENGLAFVAEVVQLTTKRS